MTLVGLVVAVVFFGLFIREYDPDYGRTAATTWYATVGLLGIVTFLTGCVTEFVSLVVWALGATTSRPKEGRALAVTAAVLGGIAILVVAYNRGSDKLARGSPELPAVVWILTASSATVLAVVCIVRFFAGRRRATRWPVGLAVVALLAMPAAILALHRHVTYVTVTAVTANTGATQWRVQVPFVYAYAAEVGENRVTIWGENVSRCAHPPPIGAVTLDVKTGRLLDKEPATEKEVPWEAMNPGRETADGAVINTTGAGDLLIIAGGGDSGYLCT